MQDTYKEVIIVLIAGSIIFVGLSGIVIFVLLFYQKRRFRHEQALLRTQLETREETFLQIGQELHDNVGQLLSTAKILMGITARSMPEVPETLSTATDVVGTAIQDLRSLSRTLNKEWLQQFNIIDNLRQEMDRINASGTITTTLEMVGETLPLSAMEGETLPLSADDQIMLFRIVQEGLQNAIRHGEACNIRIRITLVQEEVKVTITDDGKGFQEGAVAPGGAGLLNMTHRTRLLGGVIRWSSPEGQKGVQINISIPIHNKRS